MPVTNVARIPEDVCYRNEGWSRKRNHNGMDYAAGMGTAVTAAMDGVIKRFTFGTPEHGARRLPKHRRRLRKRHLH